MILCIDTPLSGDGCRPSKFSEQHFVRHGTGFHIWQKQSRPVVAMTLYSPSGKSDDDLDHKNTGDCFPSFPKSIVPMLLSMLRQRNL